jgi:serine/threonine protein phosphatase PrpC
MLPYMKYLVGEREWSRFINGSSTKQEKRKVLDALEKNLLRNSNQIRLLAEIRQHQEKYGTSLRACISRKEPMSIAEKLEGLRPKICAVYKTVGILHASMDIDVQLIVAH